MSCLRTSFPAFFSRRHISWSYFEPTGMIIRPPSASWSTSGRGTFSGEHVTMILSNGAYSVQPCVAVADLCFDVAIAQAFEPLLGLPAPAV